MRRIQRRWKCDMRCVVCLGDRVSCSLSKNKHPETSIAIWVANFNLAATIGEYLALMALQKKEGIPFSFP